jgi:hypothetical protein
MSNELDRRPSLGRGTAVVSLTAVLTCALASDALAGRSPAEPSVGERELSARVATIVERICLIKPTLQRDLPPARKIVQWRN